MSASLRQKPTSPTREPADFATAQRSRDHRAGPAFDGLRRAPSQDGGATHADVRECDHRNLRCTGCLHFAPLAEERFLDVDEPEYDEKAVAKHLGKEGAKAALEAAREALTALGEDGWHASAIDARGWELLP